MAGIRTKILALLFGSEKDSVHEPSAFVNPAPHGQASSANAAKTMATATAKNPAAVAPKQTAQRAGDFENFEKKLLSILSDQPECMVGRLNLVGLEAVKTALGPKWEAAQTRVHEKVSQIIARHLGPQDVFLRHSDVEYLVCHAALGDQQARLKSFQIAREIHNYFIGDVELSALTIRTAIAKVGRGVTFKTVKFDDISIVELDASPTPQTQPAAGNARPAEKGGRKGSNDTERQSWRDKLASKSIDDIDTRRLPYCSCKFRPAWQAQRNHIIAYMTVPTFVHPQMGSRSGYLQTRDMLEVDEYLDFDFQILDKSVDAAIDLLAMHNNNLMVLPISYDTLATSQSRTRYLNLCKEIPEKIRDMLVFQIYRLPEGAPSSRVQSVVETLKPFSRYVFASVNLTNKDYRNLEQTGLAALCLILPRNNATNKPLLRERLNYLINHCKQQRLIPCVEQVDSNQILQLALSIGIMFVSGDLIGKPIDTPTPQPCPALQEFHEMMNKP